MHSMSEYSSAIQLRSDRWSALREAASALSRDPKAKPKKDLNKKIDELFNSLAMIEPARPRLPESSLARSLMISP